MVINSTDKVGVCSDMHFIRQASELGFSLKQILEEIFQQSNSGDSPCLG